MTPKADRTREESLEQMRALIQAVRSGEMTPIEADERCIGNGLPRHHDGWKELHNITDNSVWGLPLVVLFYAWRDLGHAWEQSERYRVWGRHLWRDEPDDYQVMPLEQAETSLKSDLAQGILRAFGTDAEGEVRPIDYREWKDLAFSGDRNFNVVDASGIAVYSGAFVLRHELVPLLISEHAESTKPEGEPALRERGNQPAPKRGGGRIYAEHWHDMWAEVCRIIHEEGVPSDRLAIVKRMQQWFTDQGLEEPAPQKLNPVMDRLFKALNT